MNKNIIFRNSFIVLLILINAVVAGLIGFGAGVLYSDRTLGIIGGGDDNLALNTLFLEDGEVNGGSIVNSVIVKEESAIISTVEKASPAVVSIIITKDLPIFEEYYLIPDGADLNNFFDGNFDEYSEAPMYRQNGTKPQEVGGGSGFLVSPDGYIITNKHVVVDDEASYSVLMNDESVRDARVVAKDGFNDVAILKIEGNNFPFIELGDSSSLKVGQAVISIGNSLGEFRNTVSTGIISGLARNLTANNYGNSSEELSDVIQTDAAINLGNSGGPLLNMMGQAIGINTAIAMGAENIGFSIPINAAKNIFENVKKNGRFIRPWLGVRYIMLDSLVNNNNSVGIDYGAMIVSGATEMDIAIAPGSPAEKAGLKEGDVILEINGQRIDKDNSLSKVVSTYNVGDEVEIKILRNERESRLKLTFDEMTNS